MFDPWCIDRDWSVQLASSQIHTAGLLIMHQAQEYWLVMDEKYNSSFFAENTKLGLHTNHLEYVSLFPPAWLPEMHSFSVIQY